MAEQFSAPEGYRDRRERLEQRLARANRIDATITAACSGPIFDGLTLAQVDQDGVLQRSVRALATSVAGQVEDLDVVIYRGPHSPWGLRVMATGDDLQVLPVSVGGTGSFVAADRPTPAEPDLSGAAELAAQMWRDR